MTTTGEQHTSLAETSQPASEEGFEAASWLGRTIDERYKIEQLLGQGGMGAVFLAEHVKLQKKVALKVILPQFAGNGEVAERFAREAMASAKLEHPHVASALDYGTLPEGGAYLVMQLARGPSLRRVLEERAPAKSGWHYACEIGAQVADALSAAHAASIVHRDLKPENVMLEPREDGSELVKVLDFGIARVIDDAAGASGLTKLTRVGTIIGTPGYMSPEQALGEPVDARADVYALGVILWEICAGRELWDESEITALVTKQLTTEPPRLAAIASDIPAELDALVARMLSREKAGRPERAGEVRDTLKRLAFAATVERMSLPGGAGISGSFPATTSGSFPAAQVGAQTGGQVGVTPRTSLLSSLPPDVAHRLTELGTQLGPTVSRPPVLLALVGGGVLLALLFLSSLVMMCSSGDTPPETEVALTGPTPSSVAPEPTRAPRGVDPPEVTVVAPPTPGGFPPIPDELVADFDTLLNGSGRRARREAADRLLAHPAQSLPTVVWRVAQLEAESGCEARRDVVVALGALGDNRAIPALERLDHSRRGCGFMRSQDCYRCLRGELAETLATLRAR